MRKNGNKNKGITLIALVITIIVLLILAGVTIVSLSGDNGILSRATESKQATNKTNAKEKVQLEVMENIDESGKYNLEEIKEKLKSKLNIQDQDIKMNSDGTIDLIYDKIGLVVKKTGEVIYKENYKPDEKELILLFDTQYGKDVTLPIPENQIASTNPAPIVIANNYKVDWGDGTIEENVRNHTYVEEGNKQYKVKISGNVNKLTYDYRDNALSLVEVVQWGETGLKEINFGYYPKNLSKISSPGENSFKDVINFDRAFRDTKISSIPDDLFLNCPNVTSFRCTFEGTQITTIPERLFSNCPIVTNFEWTFSETPITTIPERLFSNCPIVTNFKWTFSQTPITTIPDNLFSNCPNVASFKYTFSGTPITTIPDNLFSNCTKVESFCGTFSDCTKLEKAIPLWNLGTNKKENEHKGSPDGEGCYNGCDLITNKVDYIPDYWKDVIAE